MSVLKNIWFKTLLVFLLAVLQYSNTKNHDYAWDDAIVLTENSRVQKGWSNIPELFENIKTEKTENRYGYRPISLLSFATDVEFFGMDPKASHRINILLYGLLCILVFYFLNTFFPSGGWRNFLLTLLFVAHPLHTEVVANIKSRDEILAMIFGLASLLFYRNAILGNRSVLMFVLGCTSLVLGFHSKESAITFAGVAFLMPLFILPDLNIKKVLKSSLPALGFLAVVLAIRAYVYSDAFFEYNDVELLEKGVFHQDGFVGNPVSDMGFSDRLAMAFYLTIYFLFRFVVPFPLVHDYSYNQLAVYGWSDWQVWISIILCIGLGALIIQGIRKRKPYGFGLMFFIVTSSVYLHIAQVAPDLFGERFLFVPSLGLIICLIYVWERISKTAISAAITVFLLIPMFVYTYGRNNAWKDNQTLLETDLPNLENCVRANYNYALFLHGEYYKAPESDKKRLEEELLYYYEHTMSLTDRLFKVYLDLGSAYMEFGYPEKALETFALAKERYPELSAPYVQMGKYHMSFKDYGKAAEEFQLALEKGSKNSDYHYLLAICLFNTERQDEAIQTLLDGEKLGVSAPAYHALIARLCVKTGDMKRASLAIDRGLKLFPTDPNLLDGRKKMDELTK